MADAYTLVLEAEPTADDVGYVRERLAAYNRQQAGDDHHQQLAIFLRDGTHTIVAGLVGDTYWGWLSIALLWVDAAPAGHREAPAAGGRSGSGAAGLPPRPRRYHEFPGAAVLSAGGLHGVGGVGGPAGRAPALFLAESLAHGRRGAVMPASACRSSMP